MLDEKSQSIIKTRTDIPDGSDDWTALSLQSLIWATWHQRLPPRTTEAYVRHDDLGGLGWSSNEVRSFFQKLTFCS